VMNPSLNANQIMEVFEKPTLKSNTMWEGVPTSAPVAEVVKPTPTPMGVPLRKRGMF
jgi:hypothetical protein